MKVNREFSQKAREQIRERAGNRCEVCRTAPIAHFHHRLLRGQGGMGTVDNGLAVCAPCHTRIHSFPAEAYELGWLLHSWDVAS